MTRLRSWFAYRLFQHRFHKAETLARSTQEVARIRRLRSADLHRALWRGV